MSEESEYTQLIDASTGEATSVSVPTERTTNEVLTMVTGYDSDDSDLTIGRDEGRPFGRAARAERKHRHEVLGRLSVDLDQSDFDAMPPNEIDLSPARNPSLYDNTWTPGVADEAPDEFPTFLAGDEAAAFEEPIEEQFPVFKKALRHFQSAESKPRVVRIDTEKSYDDFVCEKTVKELARRIDELRAAVEEHTADHHGPKMNTMRQWDILGAAEAISDLRSVKSSKEATAVLPKVPLDLPEFAEGKVHCWRDDDCVICSIRFADVDGQHRIATMAAKPKVDADEVSRWAMAAGVNPVTVLGALPDLADVACGKRLVRDVAGAALRASSRLDVCGMDEEDEPVLLANAGDASRAPLAALMYVEQRADAGDPQAQEEMWKIKTAARTPLGQRVAMPVLRAAKERLAAGRAKKAEKTKPTLMQKYALAAGWV